MLRKRPQAAARANFAQEPTIDPLVARAQAGEVAAWSQLYQRHFNKVYRRLCFFVGEPAVAEDLTQESFARAVTSVRSFDGRSSFATWLMGVALNVARNHLRSERAMRRAAEHLRPIAGLAPAADNVVERAHLKKCHGEVLFAVLLELPAHLREAFILRELEQLSTAEAAGVLEISSANVAVRVHRARELVRAALVRQGWLDAATGGAS